MPNPAGPVAVPLVPTQSAPVVPLDSAAAAMSASPSHSPPVALHPQSSFKRQRSGGRDEHAVQPVAQSPNAIHDAETEEMNHRKGAERMRLSPLTMGLSNVNVNDELPTMALTNTHANMAPSLQPPPYYSPLPVSTTGAAVTSPLPFTTRSPIPPLSMPYALYMPPILNGMYTYGDQRVAPLLPHPLNTNANTETFILAHSPPPTMPLAPQVSPPAVPLPTLTPWPIEERSKSTIVNRYLIHMPDSASHGAQGGLYQPGKPSELFISLLHSDAHTDSSTNISSHTIKLPVKIALKPTVKESATVRRFDEVAIHPLHYHCATNDLRTEEFRYSTSSDTSDPEYLLLRHDWKAPVSVVRVMRYGRQQRESKQLSPIHIMPVSEGSLAHTQTRGRGKNESARKETAQLYLAMVVDQYYEVRCHSGWKILSISMIHYKGGQEVAQVEISFTGLAADTKISDAVSAIELMAGSENEEKRKQKFEKLGRKRKKDTSGSGNNSGPVFASSPSQSPTFLLQPPSPSLSASPPTPSPLTSIFTRADVTVIDNSSGSGSSAGGVSEPAASPSGDATESKLEDQQDDAANIAIIS